MYKRQIFSPEELAEYGMGVDPQMPLVQRFSENHGCWSPVSYTHLDVYKRQGLGNGGLGRLAACFMDGLATQGYPAMGYSLRYEYGLFRQKLVDGWQTELPDTWLPGGGVWLQAVPESSVEVHFGGHIEEQWHDQYHSVRHKDYTSITAVPYDMCIAGKDGKGVSLLRVWKAENDKFDMKLFNGGNYMRAMEQQAMSEVITKVLYPEDNHPDGKLLRLSQQYFLVSASIQDIIRRPVSYTHLDVYKRQQWSRGCGPASPWPACPRPAPHRCARPQPPPKAPASQCLCPA